MSVPQANTITRLKYGKKARMGTMGILLKEGKVLLIHRRLKNKMIKTNDPPGTRQDQHLPPSQNEPRMCGRTRLR